VEGQPDPDQVEHTSDLARLIGTPECQGNLLSNPRNKNLNVYSRIQCFGLFGKIKIKASTVMVAKHQNERHFHFLCNSKYFQLKDIC
jgi:hypothetical protein